jgi:histone deacetylase complex regulatory component SIN3
MSISTPPQNAARIVENAMLFMREVKESLSENRYQDFINLFVSHRTCRIPLRNLVNRTCTLLECHPRLIRKFATFMPSGHRESTEMIFKLARRAERRILRDSVSELY